MELNLATRNITLDEFKAYTGIDLSAEMRPDSADPNNTAEAFLLRITDRLEAYIDANFYRNPSAMYFGMSDYQKRQYKLALIEQCLYVYKNSDVSVDSGYDPDKGAIASRGEMENIRIAPNARDHLMACGVWCRAIRGVGRSWGDGWLF